MPFKKKVVWGMAAALMIGGAHAESNRFGGTVYPAPPPASAAAPPTAAPPTPIKVPAKHAGHPASPRRHAPTVVAGSAIETKPAPTPSTAQAGAAQPQPAKNGPHEQPAPTINDLVLKHAKENGIPPALASAVVRIESRFDPKAHGGGAIGLMQIKIDTARSMGFAGSLVALFEPDTNLHFGMKVLADAYKASHGNVCMTLARYQSGHRVTRLSPANRIYCARARSLMAKA